MHTNNILPFWTFHSVHLQSLHQLHPNPNPNSDHAKVSLSPHSESHPYSHPTGRQNILYCAIEERIRERSKKTTCRCKDDKKTHQNSSDTPTGYQYGLLVIHINMFHKSTKTFLCAANSKKHCTSSFQIRENVMFIVR